MQGFNVGHLQAAGRLTISGPQEAIRGQLNSATPLEFR